MSNLRLLKMALEAEDGWDRMHRRTARTESAKAAMVKALREREAVMLVLQKMRDRLLASYVQG